jgi:hypothetical protein
VAAWMAGELGLAAVLAQRGWEALSDRLVGAEAAPAPSRLGHARGARGVSKRMARPVCKRLMHSDLISLLQRPDLDQSVQGRAPVLDEVGRRSSRRPPLLVPASYMHVEAPANQNLLHPPLEETCLRPRMCSRTFPPGCQTAKDGNLGCFERLCPS